MNWFLPLAWVLVGVGLLIAATGVVLVRLGRTPDVPVVGTVGWLFTGLGLPLTAVGAGLWYVAT